MELKRTIRVFYLRKLRDREYVLRALIILGFLALLTLILKDPLPSKYHAERGTFWDKETVFATADIDVFKSEQQLEQDKQKARQAIFPILVRDTAVLRQASRHLTADFDELERNLQLLRSNGDAAAKTEVLNSYFLKDPIALDPGTLPPGLAWISKLRVSGQVLLNAIDRMGYCAQLPRADSQEYLAVRTALAREIHVPRSAILLGEPALTEKLRKEIRQLSLPEKEGNILQSFLQRSIQPNLHYDQAATEAAREERAAWVSMVKETIRKGESVVEKGTLVDDRIGDRLDALVQQEASKKGRGSWGTLLGSFLLICTLTLLMLTFLRVNRPRIFFSNQKLALLMTTILLVVAAMVVATKLSNLVDGTGGKPDLDLAFIFLAPACIVPIFMNNFFDHRVAFFTNLMVTLFGAILLHQGLEYAFVQLVAGTVAVYSLRRLRKREVFFYTLGFIFLGYALAYLVFWLFVNGNLSGINTTTFLLFGVNVLLTVIGYNLIYLFEQVFRVTSDLTYLELLDTNHPLLKELAKKAPGTFQHSLQVANIAEAVVNEIGGNALLIHVGALYHDIGKSLAPRYFVENMQEEGQRENPHDKLSCQESADAIISHVAKGVALAHRYHLPRELVHFIETHHGTTRVEFFYRKHIKEKNCKMPEDEELFRYQGPLPFSKETAVLMLADSVEAATRSLKTLSLDKVGKMVDDIVDQKISDNQLVNSPLTFRDISTIREVLKRQMATIYHGRIEYPQVTTI